MSDKSVMGTVIRVAWNGGTYLSSAVLEKGLDRWFMVGTDRPIDDLDVEFDPYGDFEVTVLFLPGEK